MNDLLRQGFGGQATFGQPEFLWLLAVPGSLLLVWVFRFVSRLIDLRRLRRLRSLPVRERFAIAGDLGPWLFLVLAMASLVVALARPRGVTTVCQSRRR